MPLTITQKPLTEVSAALSSKTPIGSALASADWATLGADLREESIFSAKVESVRALSAAQGKLQKILDLSRDDNGAVSMDRGRFIAEMQRMADDLGLRNADKPRTLEDFGGERRLALIYEQMIGSAQSKAYYLSGQDPDVLDGWPAQELVRVRASTKERDWEQRWAAAGGGFPDGRMIARKTDPIWAAISRFGRAWPPFDFNSGMGLEEVDREEAEALGVIDPGEVIEPSIEHDRVAMEASVKPMSPRERKALVEMLGDGAEIVGDRVRLKPRGLAQAAMVRALATDYAADPRERVATAGRQALARLDAGDDPAAVRAELEST